jgi:acyl-CoA synthetase (AMP-forming)/AMP-acid ligase II
VELGVVLDMIVGNDPDRIAVTGPDGRALRVGDLDRHARAGAARLVGDGVGRLAWLGGNDAALPVALFAAALAGIPFAPLNYRLGDDQIRTALDDGPPTLLVATDDAAERARNLSGDVPAVPADALVGPSGWAASARTSSASSEPAIRPAELPSVDDDAVAVVLSTSGTTSRPKAAILRHRHLTSYLLGSSEFAGCGPDEAVLVSVPPYHIAGMSTILSNLFTGRRIVYLEPFDAHAWLATVRREHVTHAMVVPTMLARIVDALDGASADVPSLRSLAYGGAPTPLPVIEAALGSFRDVDFVNAYGLTETASTVALLDGADHRAARTSTDPAVRARLQSAGRALPGIEIAVRDDLGADVPAGTVGEVFVRGEQVSGEYADTESANGWFATRDRGHLDDDGYLFLDGRADDTIIRGGENIAPAEIEDVLLRHPDVRECAVVGVPDDEWGQRIAAAVVVAPGATATPQALRAWVRDRLRGSRTPDVIEVCDALPYTDTGKLLRREVRAALADR